MTAVAVSAMASILHEQGCRRVARRGALGGSKYLTDARRAPSRGRRGSAPSATLDGDGGEICGRVDERARIRLHRATVGNCEHTENHVRTVAGDRERQVAPKGRATGHAGQHVE